MLEEDHRIVAAQRRAQQPDRILGVRRHGDAPADAVHPGDLVGLAVPRIAALEEPARHAYHDGRGKTIVRAPAQRAAVVRTARPRARRTCGTGSRRPAVGPASAMPTARPMMPSSERLVSNTRALPVLVLQPERRPVHAALGAHVLTEHHHARIGASSTSSVRRMAVSMFGCAHLRGQRAPRSTRRGGWPSARAHPATCSAGSHLGGLRRRPVGSR